MSALDNAKMFHILSNGKVKELTIEQYLRILGRKGYSIGWVDASHVCFTKGEHTTFLPRRIVEQVFSLFDNAEASA